MNIRLIDGNYQDDKGNSIISPRGLKKVFVEFHGENNSVIIEEGCLISDYTIKFLSSNSSFKIGHSHQIRRCIHNGIIDLGYGCSVILGNNVTAPFGVYMTCSEKTSITVGNDCTFAAGTLVRADDSHMIFDIVSGKRSNPSRSVSLGNHVWVGERAGILSGASIGDGCVVGFQSVVKGKYPNNCLVAGNPSIIRKKNIAWDRAHTLFSTDSTRHASEYPEVSYDKNNWRLTSD